MVSGFPQWLSGKESACNAGDRDAGSIPGSGRSRGNGNPLQYSCQGNPIDKEAYWATVHGSRESDTTERLNTNLWCPLSHISLWTQVFTFMLHPRTQGPQRRYIFPQVPITVDMGAEIGSRAQPPVPHPSSPQATCLSAETDVPGPASGARTLPPGRAAFAPRAADALLVLVQEKLWHQPSHIASLPPSGLAS